MTDRLYIIGNGFDLHHQLKTKYENFSKYLQTNDNELHSFLETYINCPDPSQCLWNKFEENLAYLNVTEILSEHAYLLPDYASDDYLDRDKYAFPDEMENYLQWLTDGLIESFQSFIQEVEYPKTAFEHQLIIDSNSSFLTFNYTNTLERLYGVDRKNILYIHNSAFFGTNTIVLGHGTDPEYFKEELPDPPDDIDPEDYEKWYQSNIYFDYSYSTGEETLMRYFQATWKPTGIIIEEKLKFFNGLKNIKEIWVLGHSISKIDLPYFAQICKSIDPMVEWRVSFYSAEEYKNLQNTLVQIGIDQNRITMFKLEDIQLNYKQLRFDF